MCEQRGFSYQFLVKGLMVLATGYLLVAPLGNSTLMYLFRLPALLLIFLFCVHYCLTQKLLARNVFSLVALVGVIILNCVYNNIALTSSDVVAVLSFLAYVFLIMLSSEINLDCSTRKFVYRFAVVCALIMIAYSFTSRAYWDGKRVGIYLVLGFANPNLTAIYLFMILALIYISLFDDNKGNLVMNICKLGCLVFLFYLIWKTNSRMIMIVTIFLVILSFVYSKKIPTVIIYFCLIVPFLFVPIYIFGSTFLENVSVMGKELFSGRQNTFSEYLIGLSDPIAWVWGNMSKNMFQNAHNGPLAIFTSVGLVGTIAFFEIFYGRIIEANRNSKSRTALVAVISIISCVLHGCGEAALFLGGFPGVVFMFILLTFLPGYKKL